MDDVPPRRSRSASAPTLQHMFDSPMFSKLEADRILKRAAEIEGSDDTGPLTIDELRSIAGEAGFGSQAVERAIVEAQRAGSTEVRHHPVDKSGMVITHLSTVRAIPIQISADQLMQAVRLFPPYREGPAHVHLGDHQITWRDRTGLRFTVTSAGGVTEVRVYVSKIVFFRKGIWVGWVKSAADRLEELVFLVAARDLPGTEDVEARLESSNSATASLQHRPTSGQPTETR